ncbi:hypothetical protein BDB00DRAFT_835119 [Zychaea mexicana]|uniref:uncharacterized protein n=1 Tax=Zychaea mexicana TaxID=64656 RepID=UPI0022FDC365|nr:uncharacterized protein BDB00DRAFT_835119 [Zychaea mexicana]KAI9491087.1 hypothetical protein BDB00DRAFT_835119 [Zychaea mexicana]
MRRPCQRCSFIFTIGLFPPRLWLALMCSDCGALPCDMIWSRLGIDAMNAACTLFTQLAALVPTDIIDGLVGACGVYGKFGNSEYK